MAHSQGPQNIPGGVVFGGYSLKNNGFLMSKGNTLIFLNFVTLLEGPSKVPCAAQMALRCRSDGAQMCGKIKFHRKMSFIPIYT